MYSLESDWIPRSLMVLSGSARSDLIGQSIPNRSDSANEIWKISR